MAKILGIDLGTTNSCMAVIENGEAKIIPNKEGARTTPSVVHFSKGGERVLGSLAKRKSAAEPERTAQSIKRIIGSKENLSFGEKNFIPREISAMVLQKLKLDAEDYLGEKVEKAVITVPAYFEDNQRQATKDAGKIAGLEVMRVVNEPTAAALAYGLEREDDQVIMVYDFGGGTFDGSLLHVRNGLIEVLAVSGNNELGGNDFDDALMEYIAEDFKVKHEIDLLDREAAVIQRLKEASEKAKIDLSSVKETNISLPFIVEGPLNIDMDITRAKFNQLTGNLIEETKEICKKILADADLEAADLDEVILVGGSTRIPAVQKMVEDLTRKKPLKNINPDEVVAVGAALQGGVLSGEIEEFVLIDAVSLSLGIETKGGLFSKIIERNTSIPTSDSKEYTTSFDNQTDVSIHVLQGERDIASENKTIGNFQLSKIPEAPKGEPKIVVKFNIDENCIVQVSAKVIGSNNEERVTIKNIDALSEDELERMIREAEEYAEEDKKRVERAELQNEIDDLLYKIKKKLYGENSSLSNLEIIEMEKARSSLEKLLSEEDNRKVRNALNKIKKEL